MIKSAFFETATTFFLSICRIEQINQHFTLNALPLVLC